MKARDIDMIFTATGAVLIVGLFLMVGFGILKNVSTTDCIMIGAAVASCSKPVAISRWIELIKSK